MKLPVFISWLFFAVGVCMLVAAVFVFQETRDFLSSAERAEGTIVDLLPVRSDTGKKVSITFRPVIEFRTAGGRDIEFQSSTSSTSPSYHEGAKVQVVYRPDEPQNAEIDGFFPLWGAATILAVLGAAFGGVGLAMVLALGGAASRRKRLLLTGTPVRAKIMAIERNERLKVNGQHPFRVLAHWKDPITAEVHVFQSDNLWSDPTTRLDNPYIVVHLDARNPKRYVMDTSFLDEPR